MNIVMAASEMTPFAKTGGLADVLGALPYALAQRGHEVSVFIPFYRGIETHSPEILLQDRLLVGNRRLAYEVVRINHRDGVNVYAVRKDEYFDRSQLYGLSDRAYDDNAERFIFFSKAVVHAIQALGFRPHVVHAHDWQTALIPVYLRMRSSEGTLPAIKTVFTIHNLAYQGLFEAYEFHNTNLPSHLFSLDGLEYFGRMNLMKGGIAYSDVITTVSPRYAQEIQTPDFGCGLDGVLRSKKDSLYGILNGVDYRIWNPETDSYLEHPFNSTKLERKKKCKIALAKSLSLEATGKRPTFGMVSRLAHQKGIELLIEILPEMLERDVQIAILGNGDDQYEKTLQRFAEQFPRQFGLKLGFDEKLAHEIYGGSDFLLMPSLFEPCGLSQLYALRYGTIPIVRATGGLEDTVRNWNGQTGNGFKFNNPSAAELLECIDQALKVYNKPKSIAMIRQDAMACDFSWEKSASEYELLYQSHA